MAEAKQNDEKMRKEIRAFLEASYANMSDEAIIREAKAMGLDLSQSLKRDNPSHKKEFASKHISQSTKKRLAIQNEEVKK